jgi:branched-chain amino acid transport system ATP-binding protein
MSDQPQARQPLLQIAGLCSGYGDVQILWDVALDVFPGEVVALIGANGAGKTTLLRTISQVIRPSAGRISFDGRDLTDTGTDQVVAAGIVHVPQGRRLFAGLTVKENLLQGAYLRRDRRAVRADLERVIGLLPRLGERLNQLAGRMSGGEQQMCAIGRGLMARPRLLLLDEPSLGLAPVTVKLIFDTLQRVNGDGMTIMLVEQNVPRALQLSHRGYVLENGRIVLEGTRESLRASPHVKQAYLGL